MATVARTLIFTLILQLSLGVAYALAAQPLQVVKSVIEQALDILKNPSYSREVKERMVKQIVDPHFDYREMAKRSLGQTWSTLNKGQQDEFVRLFAELLENSYSDKIEKYAQRVKIDYAGENIEGQYAEVRTVVVRPNDRIPLTYRLIQEGGTWKVYDVVIEGVSLIANYRSQFARIIHESSYANLVERLRSRAATIR